MLNNFTHKKIGKEKSGELPKNGAEKLPEIYKAEAEEQLEKPRGGYGMIVLACFLATAFSLAAIFVYDGFFREPMGGGVAGQRVIVDKQENITVTFEERLGYLNEQASQVVVSFYKKPTETSGYFFETAESFGGGVVITNDGWVATSKGLLAKIGKEKYIILTNNQKVFEVESVVLDPGSDLAFVKIDGRDLPVAKFGETKNVVSGQELYGIIKDFPKSRMASLHVAEVDLKNGNEIIESTEKMNLVVFCQEGYDMSLLGAPLINISGEVIAIVNNQSEAVPMAYTKTILDGLLKKNKITRTSLGVNYINLAKHPKIDSKTGELVSRGALLSGYKNVTAVVKNSQAEKAGLKSGDIIISVEENTLGEKESLGEIIQNYLPGQKIKMTIVREDKEKGIEVTLGKTE